MREAELEQLLVEFGRSQLTTRTMRAACTAVVASIAACGDAKNPSSATLAATRLELTLDDGTKPPALDGRAFAVRSTNDELHVFVFDGSAEPTCTDVNVGGWMERASAGSAAQIRVAHFGGRSGKYRVAGIAHVGGGGGKGKVALRSASAKGVTLEIVRYEEVFEGRLAGGGASGTVSGLVCAAK
jgi:hypothetical protein